MNTKTKVYYHDHYSILANFDDLNKYDHCSTHYPQLIPISWTNILNIIANGC